MAYLVKLLLVTGVLVSCCCACARAQGDDEEEEVRLPRTRIVQTKYGKVQGRVVRVPVKTNRQLTDVQLFYGIPYATPPVGSNRQVI